MPASAIGAGVGAVSSVAGGISSGKGAKKAAKIQAQSAAEQRAQLERMYGEAKTRLEPTIDNGNAAENQIMDLLGLSGNPVDATEILRNIPGYQFKMDEALRGVNSNAYAAGMGNSGASLRALQRTSQGVADQGFNQYLGQVSSVADRGGQAKGALTGVSTNYTQASNQTNQNAADSAANYQIFKAQNFNNTLEGILGAGGQAFGSSYGKGGK